MAVYRRDGTKVTVCMHPHRALEFRNHPSSPSCHAILQIRIWVLALTARMFGQSPIRRGETVQLVIKPDRIHDFDDGGMHIK